NEQFVADAMGHVTDHHVTQGSGTTFPSTDTTGSGYQAWTGRLLTQATIGNTSTTTYTAAGERAVDETVPRQSGGGTFSRYYYRADGLLIAVDHRTCTTTRSCIPSGLNPPTLTGAFEDYRYDALGRRVQVRTRTDSICEGASCTSSLMWVVWDGSQIAAEIRVPGGDGLSGDSLETGCGCGPMYGSVEYLNGPTFDQPLEIQGILVHRTWRGLIDGGARPSMPTIRHRRAHASPPISSAGARPKSSTRCAASRPCPPRNPND